MLIEIITATITAIVVNVFVEGIKTYINKSKCKCKMAIDEDINSEPVINLRDFEMKNLNN